jgi:AcrR family transcriptional regulator
MKTKAAPRRTLDAAARRTQILEAARSLLIEKGYGDLLLDDVARRAGVAKGTLYLYFSDKRELFAAVKSEIIGSLENAVRTAAGEADAPLEKLRAAVTQMLAYIDANQDLFLACGPSHPRARPAGDVRKGFQSYIAALSAAIEPGVRAGRIRAHDPKTGSMMLIAFARMFLMRKVYHGRTGPLAACADEMMDLFLNGLGAR